jgi:hypothetical protein
MIEHRFEPVPVFENSEVMSVASVEEALALLLTKSGCECAVRADAFEACISSWKGEIPAAVARDAFIDFTHWFQGQTKRRPCVVNEVPDFRLERRQGVLLASVDPAYYSMTTSPKNAGAS